MSDKHNEAPNPTPQKKAIHDELWIARATATTKKIDPFYKTNIPELVKEETEKKGVKPETQKVRPLTLWVNWFSLYSQ